MGLELLPTRQRLAQDLRDPVLAGAVGEDVETVPTKFGILAQRYRTTRF